MLLEKIRLQNIRSYTDQTIEFTKGSTLLAGDIGCGKSSILLAVEFALFGTARPDLPAEALLRKGAMSGSAELAFTLEGKHIIIKRNLKKDSRSIKQTSGHIILNGVKRELMPLELKAEVLNLLGYPQDLLSKNKNYVFRYTVYTPQEEMKFILQESSEVRLDVLRKIFNIDKYKNVRDNLQISLKEMRTKITVLQTRIEPLTQEEEQLTKIEQEIKQVKETIGRISVQHAAQKKEVENQDLVVCQIEKEQHKFIQLQQQLHMSETSLAGKQEEREHVARKLKELELKIDKSFSEKNLNKEVIEQEIAKHEVERSQILHTRTSLQERISHLQTRLAEISTQIEKSSHAATIINEKEVAINELKKEMLEKQELVGKKDHLSSLLEKTNDLISKNQVVLEQARKTSETIALIKNCPTCLQDVTKEHKSKIHEREVSTITKATQLLEELNTRKKDITSQHSLILEQIQKHQEQKELLLTTTLELEQLFELQKTRREHEQTRTSLVQENNRLMKDFAQVQDEKREVEITAKLKTWREQLEELTRAQMLESQRDEMRLRIETLQKLIVEIEERRGNLQKDLLLKKDRSQELVEKKKELGTLREKEKNVAIEKMRLQTLLENSMRIKEECVRKITKLMQEKSELVRTQEMYHWLTGFFVPLTITIEKHVMLQIHRLFNELFKEWFSILIDDENMSARIDDGFSPMIEQNGYEMEFRNLSGGEKTSASLAYRLALNRVINDVVHEINTKDVLILDEPTDGFSSEQLDKVRDVLDVLNLRQSIIVSHESKIESFVQNVVHVRKQGHESYVE